MSDTKVQQEKKMEKKYMIDRDEEFLKDKLLGFVKIKPEDIRVGDHLRITKNKYKSEGRICTYNVITSVTKEDNGELTFEANNYKNREYPDWILDFTNQYKQLQAYRKPPLKENNECDTCGLFVKQPYHTCWNCRT